VELIDAMEERFFRSGFFLIALEKVWGVRKQKKKEGKKKKMKTRRGWQARDFIRPFKRE
jgi:hypothetical protein